MTPLDRTEQRILGVLLEKELAVPESYPLTLNALLLGCNQKSNRDPELSLEEFEVQGALTSLRLKEWVAESERDGGRAKRYRHRVEAKLAVDPREKAVLAELLLRGPQTPMELKSRIARMGEQASAGEVDAVLAGLTRKPDGALVELLPRAPRERDARWAHRLGPRDEAAPGAGQAQVPAAPAAGARAPDLASRIEALERRVTELERRAGASAEN